MAEEETEAMAARPGGDEVDEVDGGEREEEYEVEGDEENEVEGAEEEEEDEEGGYSMQQLSRGMDLLDFAHQDVAHGGGLELYQHFEEYDVLAERKRKALQASGSEGPAKKRLQQNGGLGVTAEEIDEMMNFGSRRRARGPKKRGRRKGSKNKVNPEADKKVIDAMLYFAEGSDGKAIRLLEEAVRLAPNLRDAFYMLSNIYEHQGNRKKALNFLMIAAHLQPKDPPTWRQLAEWSMEQNNIRQAQYCLSKGISANPEDLGLKFDRALQYYELGEYQKAAETYDQILGLCPTNILACRMAAKMYQKCGQGGKAISILEDYVKVHSSVADQSVISLLITLQMENNAHAKALCLIDNAHLAYGSDKKLTMFLKANAVICQAHLGNMENAEVLLYEIMQMEHANDNDDLIIQVGDTFASLGYYDYALKFYFTQEGTACLDNDSLHLKIGHCYISLKDSGKAIPFFYKALSRAEDNVDARVTLSSLLLQEGKEDEAILLLCAPNCLESVSSSNSPQCKPWWLSGKVKMQLANIYHTRGMLKEFIDTISSDIRETLDVETNNQKVKRRKKRLTRNVLAERVKLLDDQKDDSIFHRFKPIASNSEILKATRAKKSLLKKELIREEKREAALAAGMDWQSEDSEDEASREELKDPPLPGLLMDEENYQLILDLCKALVSLHRHWEAVEIITHTLKLADSKLSVGKREELQMLLAQIAYNTRDPQHAKDVVKQHPYSMAAWNYFYKVVSRTENWSSKYLKFLHRMRAHNDCLPPLLISGHQFTILKQHQAAARVYLEAYKQQPDNPLISLCAGTALINLALGFRIQNKHQCIVQGFAFLYNYLHICNNSQEALYNIARAYHHVGMVTLAASYYEKVLSIPEEDYPIPRLPNEELCAPISLKPGYCSLHREAAYNLHLIYMKSGAVDLARQVLKDYCSL